MTVLITGAANGLGQALTKILLEQGQRVIGLDRVWGEEENNQLVKITSDLSDIAGFDPLMDVLHAHGPFDLVIFNAAVSATGPYEVIPNEAHSRLIDINTANPTLMAHHLIKNHGLTEGSTLVFIASLSVQIGYPGATSYTASKAFIANLAKGLRHTMKRQKGHVLTVYPGPMKTDQASRHAPKEAKTENRMDAEDVAQQILAACTSRKKELIPGISNKLFALFGKIAPNLIGQTMKKIIYDKLQHPTY